MEDNKITIGTVVYYAQCLTTTGTFEVLELKVRTVEDTWFVGIDKSTKHAYLFYNKDIGSTIFFNRQEALDVVKTAEKNCKNKYDNETYYEEY